MSTPIGSVSQLVHVIRSQLNARAPARRVAASDATVTRYAEQNLAALIEVRVKQIGRDDPQRGRKAFRVFLEAVLLAQFGEQMLADPQFYQLLDDVQRAMQADPACAQLMDQAIAQLLAQPA